MFYYLLKVLSFIRSYSRFVISTIKKVSIYYLSNYNYSLYFYWCNNNLSMTIYAVNCNSWITGCDIVLYVRFPESPLFLTSYETS